MKRIVQITSEETLSIRHKVMWPNKPIDYVQLPNDFEGRHFGYFKNDILISVISLFVENNEAQFRKFATLKEYQGKGFGSELLNELMRISAKEQLSKIWCNARINKIDYYSKFGMKETNNQFIKGGISYVIMERIF
ncbi:Acetyltransferase (GNAT) domain-containing protein [Maribacter orientalis]|uniref:Acetyltransferase (GNAT) domain-containing protein n=1 Tax=Maribacter orientalis TaxID=228957 RepID=A0A1H7UCL9_9FLAO|nr:GNAT family N-acetyltransferase [Maribacter orientalis]SEL94007.1 Acetyltransferase (GNAT) domain-containing protein [Maribacter orientalis]